MTYDVTILTNLLQQPDAGYRLWQADEHGQLVTWFPELAACRDAPQPSAHAFGVLEHSLEAVTAIDWLLAELEGTTLQSEALPEAAYVEPDLHWTSRYNVEWCAHLSSLIGRFPRTSLLRLAALLHDNAKPQTRRVEPNGRTTFYEHQTIGAELAKEACLRVGFTEQEATYVWRIVRDHMRPGQLGDNGPVTMRTIHRFFHATAGCGPDVLLHAMADHLATRGPNVSIKSWWEHCRWTDYVLDTLWAKTEEVPVLLDGHTLMQALQIPPGPLVGRILDAIGEAQAEERINTSEEALALARTLYNTFTSGG